MSKVTIVGIDLAKRVLFALHGVDGGSRVTLRRRTLECEKKRSAMRAFAFFCEICGPKKTIDISN